MTRNVKILRATSWLIVTGIGLLAAACGDNAPGRLDDEPLPCNPVTTTFEIDHADPSAFVAEEIDLDGDNRPDDALGRAHDAVAAFAPEFEAAERLEARLATDVSWALTLEQCNGHVRVTLAPPADALPHFPRAVGTIATDGTLVAEDGTGRVPLVALADASGTTTDPGWRTGDALTIRAALDGDHLTGVFAMALPTTTVKADLAAPIAAFLTKQPATQAMRAGADSDRDGIVTATELAATGPYQGMTQADLDLVIDGQPQTSIAFSFHATAKR